MNLAKKEVDMNDALISLIEKSRKIFDNLSDDEKNKMRLAQRKAYILAEAKFGSDTDEQNYSSALLHNDNESLEKLDKAAEERVSLAEKYLRTI